MSPDFNENLGVYPTFDALSDEHKIRARTGSQTGSTSKTHAFELLNIFLTTDLNLKQNFWNLQTGSTPLKPEVPLKFTILSFKIHFWQSDTISNEILKPEVPFPNRKYAL